MAALPGRGQWRFVNRHPQGEAAFYGGYREITPPSRLVFTEIFEQFPDSVSVVTTDFSDEDGKTRLTVTVRYPSLEVRDMVLASGMARGAGISYGRLEELVAELHRPGTQDCTWLPVSAARPFAYTVHRFHLRSRKETPCWIVETSWPRPPWQPSPTRTLLRNLP